jgi:hypothetical protein
MTVHPLSYVRDWLMRRHGTPPVRPRTDIKGNMLPNSITHAGHNGSSPWRDSDHGALSTATPTRPPA